MVTIHIRSKIQICQGKLLLSQEVLAKEIGISYPTLNCWKKGHNPTCVF